MSYKPTKAVSVFGTNREQLLNQATGNVGVITTLTPTSELVKLLRDGAYISRSRNINLDYAKVADEAADSITELEAQLADAKQVANDCRIVADDAISEAKKYQWQPIETAPKGANGYSWMLLAWGHEGDKNIGSGMYADGKFYTSATFHRPSTGRRFCFDEIEVNPTHWMPLPAAPAIQAEGKA